MAQLASMQPDDLLGTSLGHYEILELLGEGGMARVYRARQARLERMVAVKVLPPHFASDRDFTERFQQEARAMAQLAHANIVTVHDAGADQGRLYIVMEFVNGGNLKQRIVRRPLDADEIMLVVRQIGGALQYAHEHKIIHRDVKPMNVLLERGAGAANDPHPDAPRITRTVLTDFGIAKVLEGSLPLTRAGAGVGTPEYMSPEQCQGVPIDHRADIYAMGCMLYEMLTGRPPFIADNYTAMAHAQIYEQPVPPMRLNPRGVLPAVQAVVLRALAKSPADRFQSAQEMVVSLQQAFDEQRITKSGPTSLVGGYPAPVRCMQCGADNAQGQPYCSQCGAPLMAVRPSFAPQISGVVDPRLVTCPQCHTLNTPVNRFCTLCGVSLGTKLCPRCQKPNPASMRYCTRCGTVL